MTRMLIALITLALVSQARAQSSQGIEGPKAQGAQIEQMFNTSAHRLLQNAPAQATPTAQPKAVPVVVQAPEVHAAPAAASCDEVVNKLIEETPILQGAINAIDKDEFNRRYCDSTGAPDETYTVTYSRARRGPPGMPADYFPRGMRGYRFVIVAKHKWNNGVNYHYVESFRFEKD